MSNKRREWLEGLTHFLIGAGPGVAASHYLGEAGEAYSHAYRNNPEDMPIEGHLFRHSGTPVAATGVVTGALASGSPEYILSKIPGARRASSHLGKLTGYSRKAVPYIALSSLSASIPAAEQKEIMRRNAESMEGKTGIDFNVNRLPPSGGKLSNRSEDIANKAMEAVFGSDMNSTTGKGGNIQAGNNQATTSRDEAAPSGNRSNIRGSVDINNLAAPPEPVANKSKATAVPPTSPPSISQHPQNTSDNKTNKDVTAEQVKKDQADKKTENATTGMLSPAILAALLVLGLPATAGLMSLFPGRDAGAIDDDEEDIEREYLDELRRRKRKRRVLKIGSHSSGDPAHDCVIELMRRSSRY